MPLNRNPLSAKAQRAFVVNFAKRLRRPRAPRQPLVCLACLTPLRKSASFCEPCGRDAMRVRNRAVAAISVAIRTGKLPRAATLTCVDCGKPARHWEHRYYSAPLDVSPVCEGCNAKRGHALDLVELVREYAQPVKCGGYPKCSTTMRADLALWHIERLAPYCPTCAPGQNHHYRRLVIVPPGHPQWQSAVTQSPERK